MQVKHCDEFVQVEHSSEQFIHCESIPLSNVEGGQPQKFDRLRDGEDATHVSQDEAFEQVWQVRLHAY
jgi:hypothetical protein